MDPLDSLTYAAAHTSRVGLGTSVLDMPYYPVLLARRLTTLDVLSGGRLRVGLGQGWSQDEFDATGASM
jgi:alkanesulfonate monooxygenase SsuD/methylene tetrahydromethanopterin reductase-like flavin-dependent oxidoreductase (luciferase family)